MTNIPGERLRPTDREPRSAELTRNLLTYLLSGEFAPGERIPSERQLSTALNVGRSAIREALKVHTALGLLDVRQGDGTYLAKSSSDLLPQVIEWGLLAGEQRVWELVEARQHIEVTLCELAALRRTEVQLQSLEDLLASMKAAGDLDTYVRLDIEFHLALADASGNAVLRDFVRGIRSLLAVWTRRVIHNLGDTSASWELHESICAAVRSQDAAAAREAMERHMVEASMHLAETLAASDTRQPGADGDLLDGVAP